MSESPDHSEERIYTDPAGHTWRVSAISHDRIEQEVALGSLAREFHSGWLCFQSGSRRCCWPGVPHDWREFSDEQLETIRQLSFSAPASSREGQDPSESRD